MLSFLIVVPICTARTAESELTAYSPHEAAMTLTRISISSKPSSSLWRIHLPESVTHHPTLVSSLLRLSRLPCILAEPGGFPSSFLEESSQIPPLTLLYKKPVTRLRSSFLAISCARYRKAVCYFAVSLYKHVQNPIIRRRHLNRFTYSKQLVWLPCNTTYSNENESVG